MLSASCNAAGVVTAVGIEVPDTVILSAGKQASTGILLLDGELAIYIPSNTTDIQTTIQKLIDTITQAAAAITKIGTSLTSIGAGMTGPTTAPPPTLAADVADLTTKVVALNQIKTDLTTLKGALK